MKKVLDNLTVKNLKVPGRFTDGLVKGLHIWVKPTLQKHWILRYSYKGKQQDSWIGQFPIIGVAEARIEAQKLRDKLISGINPNEEKIKANVLKKESEASKITFKQFALQCIEKKRKGWKNQKHADQWVYSLSEFAFPLIGDKYLNEINTSDILNVLNPIWETKTHTASRLRGRIEWILGSATTQNLRSGSNPAVWRTHLETVLEKPGDIAPTNHFKALDCRDIPEFIFKLKERDGVAALALEFTILNANRTGEVIFGLRKEVDDGIWRIPAERMKRKIPHEITLCNRSLDLLNIAKIMDPDSPYLFSRNGKHLSNLAMSNVLKRMDIDATVHGFRSTFRDWVSEKTEHSYEVAEMALAHNVGSKVERTYLRTKLRERRKNLLQDWEDYCSSYKTFNLKLKAA
jgi:integrase